MSGAGGTVSGAGGTVSGAGGAVPAAAGGSPWTRGPRRRDEGSGTVLVIALLAVAVVLAAALGTLGRAQVTRGRAQAAADLAALAAAAAVAVPAGVTVTTEALEAVDPCGRARTVAERNGGRVTSCAAGTDGVVSVTVTVDGGRGPFALTAGARARAGPASARAPG